MTIADFLAAGHVAEHCKAIIIDFMAFPGNVNKISSTSKLLALNFLALVSNQDIP